MAGALTFEAIRSDPVRFCREVLRFEPWSKQRAIMESVRDRRRTAVRSGHGTGKTAGVGRVVLWWLAGAPGSMAITTSATFNQVREQLWREIAAGFHAAGGADGFFDGKLTDTRLELAPDWFAIGLSTDTPERFAGYHGERLLVVLDEASGVSEAVWEAAETLITSPASRLLAVGNPTRPAGSFYRAFTSERELYNTIHVSAYDSPAVTGEKVPEAVLRRLVGPEWIDDRRRAWGEQSPLFQVRVLGEFPTIADDSIVPLGDVEAATSRDVEAGYPVVVAVDVARFGSDETVIVVRHGNRVRVAKVLHGRDTMQVAGEVVRVVRGADRAGVRVVVDDVGVGGGVTDRLRELGYNVLAFNGGARARQRDDYPNRRSEAWFALSERLGELDLPADEQLIADLVAPRYSIDSHGRRVVEAKELTKRRLGRSPDRGDAVVMAFAVDAYGSTGGEHAGAEDAAVMPAGAEALVVRRERALARRDGRGFPGYGSTL